VLISHPGGAQSVLHTTILGATPTTATVSGSEAVLHVPGAFYRPGGFGITVYDGRPPLAWCEPESAYDGLAYEAAEVTRRVSAAETGTPVRPPSRLDRHLRHDR
jgi:hypothetical protein